MTATATLQPPAKRRASSVPRCALVPENTQIAAIPTTGAPVDHHEEAANLVEARMHALTQNAGYEDVHDYMNDKKSELEMPPYTTLRRVK